LVGGTLSLEPKPEAWSLLRLEVAKQFRLDRLKGFANVRTMDRRMFRGRRAPQFLAEAKTAGLDVTLVSTDELRHGIEDLSRAPPDVFDYVRRLLAAGRGG